jgi:RHS repeat-associated protein
MSVLGLSNTYINGLPSATVSKLGYTGHTALASSGLIYMRARNYDPEIGRFITADTVVPDPLSSQDHNRYSYAVNNPLKYTDPTGNTHVICITEGPECSHGNAGAGGGRISVYGRPTGARGSAGIYIPGSTLIDIDRVVQIAENFAINIQASAIETIAIIRQALAPYRGPAGRIEDRGQVQDGGITVRPVVAPGVLSGENDRDVPSIGVNLLDILVPPVGAGEGEVLIVFNPTKADLPFSVHAAVTAFEQQLAKTENNDLIRLYNSTVLIYDPINQPIVKGREVLAEANHGRDPDTITIYSAFQTFLTPKGRELVFAHEFRHLQADNIALQTVKDFVLNDHDLRGSEIDAGDWARDFWNNKFRAVQQEGGS